MSPKTMIIDGIALFGLLGALGLVLALDSKSTTKPSSIDPVPIEEIVETPVVPPIKMAVTVSDKDFDNMGKLLSSLGSGYTYEVIQMDELLNLDRLKEFDVLFFTCGVFPNHFTQGRVTVGARKGTTTGSWKPEIHEKLKHNLVKFVQDGGTLYASDWRFDIVASAFENYYDSGRSSMGDGAVQNIDAEVTDEGLRELIGDRIKLDFPKSQWKAAAFSGSKVTTYMRGSYRKMSGANAITPLLVKFPCGKGLVIFTSFHNESVNSEVETKLLKFLVFTAINSENEKTISKTMVKGGFSPVRKSLLNASSGTRSIKKEYQCKKAGPLTFLLVFQSRGATLKLTVTDPDGKKVEKTGPSTFSIDIGNAKVGKWYYSIEPIKVPHDNFPFNLVIGEK